MKHHMSWRIKIAFFCYLLTILLLAVFALIYLFRSEFMPYHAVAVGKTWAEVDPAFQILIKALMRVTGGGWMATVCAMGFLLFIPFRRGARWAVWALPLIGLFASLSSLYATILVARNTPASPPWVAAALGAVLLVVGFILSAPPEGKAVQK